MSDAAQPAAVLKTGAKATAPAAKKSGGKMLMIIVAAVVVIAGGAGGWLWHMRSAKAQQAIQSAAPAEKTEVKSVMHLESFIVNLQGGSGASYLRIGIDLGLAGEAKEGEKEAAPTGRIRDAILSVLGAQSVDALLTPEGKEKLKSDIVKSISDRVPEIQCKEVYFTEFLVQQ